MHTQVEIRRSTVDDIQPIAENMREVDRQEIMASDGRLPAESLMLGLADPWGECWTVLLDEEPIAMFGCCPSPDPEAAGVWLLATDKFETMTVWKELLQRSPAYVERWNEDYSRLFNIVDCRHEQSIRWLTWLGFEIVDQSDEWTHEKRPFVLVIKYRNEESRCVTQPH